MVSHNSKSHLPLAPYPIINLCACRIVYLENYIFFGFCLQQSFTSNWPKTLWMAVDQRGVHLLEFRTRNVLNSFEYDSILDYTPSLNHMLLITGTDKKQSKIIVNTNQVNLIKCLIFLDFKVLTYWNVVFVLVY